MLININMDQLSGSSGIRGENTIEALDNHARAETSPHTRGEQISAKRRADRAGNIPAYAGRTLLELKNQGHLRKHPRIRGENKILPVIFMVPRETSPHTRGEHGITMRAPNGCRNIPAYAGRTRLVVARDQRQRKHPRIRGENSNILNY